MQYYKKKTIPCTITTKNEFYINFSHKRVNDDNQLIPVQKINALLVVTWSSQMWFTPVILCDKLTYLKPLKSSF